MCHPGYCDEELVGADPVTLSRERELSFLLSPAFMDMLDRIGARLARLSDALVDGISTEGSFHVSRHIQETALPG